MTTLLWINGYRSNVADDDPTWIEYVVDQILDRVADENTSDTTANSESACGYEPSVYWYVACPQQLFTGGIVTLWEAPPSSVAAGGVCPFDTGGMVTDKIATVPPLTGPSERIEYVKESDADLIDWSARVTGALTSSYPTLEHYVAGEKPDPPMTKRDHSANTSSQAWAWESRLQKDATPYRLVTLRHLVAPAQRFKRFFAWIGQELMAFDDDSYAELMDRVDSAQQHSADDVLQFVQDTIVQEL